MNVTIAMMIGSDLSRLELVETAITSLTNNVGSNDFKLIIGMLPSIDPKIEAFIDMIDTCDNIIKMKSLQTWPQFVNYAYNHGDSAKWFIIVHDDIELITPNLIPRVDAFVSKALEPIGWISLTDNDYLNNNHFAPPTRPGFHRDFLFEHAWPKRKVFQFHTLPTKWWLGTHEHWFFDILDYPGTPVKCHTPFDHFMIIESDKFRQIGLCENWCPTPLLQDEDLGLRAAELGLFNIWMPDLMYTHNRDTGGTRSKSSIKLYRDAVHRSFLDKWGFHHDLNARNDITKIKQEWKNTNIGWSIDKRTYEWEIVKCQ
jgi:hypothetical protein